MVQKVEKLFYLKVKYNYFQKKFLLVKKKTLNINFLFPEKYRYFFFLLFTIFVWVIKYTFFFALAPKQI